MEHLSLTRTNQYLKHNQSLITIQHCIPLLKTTRLVIGLVRVGGRELKISSFQSKHFVGCFTSKLASFVFLISHFFNEDIQMSSPGTSEMATSFKHLKVPPNISGTIQKLKHDPLSSYVRDLFPHLSDKLLFGYDMWNALNMSLIRNIHMCLPNS